MAFPLGTLIVDDFLFNENWKKSEHFTHLPLPPRFSTKGKEINTKIFEVAQEVQFKTWYNVYTKDGKTFGFSTLNGYISNHPEWKYEGMPVKEYKLTLMQIAKNCVKIAEQNIN